MFVLRSTCFQAPCHAYAQIYVLMCSLPCLCLDLHVRAQICVPMLRSMCLCALYHACVLRSMSVAMPCASIALLSLDVSLSCVLAFIGGVQIQTLWFRPTSAHLDLYQRVWIISFKHIYLRLFASMLYLYVRLSRSWIFHALCLPWACACRSLGQLALCGYIVSPQSLFGCNHL